MNNNDMLEANRLVMVDGHAMRRSDNDHKNCKEDKRHIGLKISNASTRASVDKRERSYVESSRVTRSEFSHRFTPSFGCYI